MTKIGWLPIYPSFNSDLSNKTLISEYINHIKKDIGCKQWKAVRTTNQDFHNNHNVIYVNLRNTLYDSKVSSNCSWD